MTRSGDRVLVAVSGGSDSVGLLAILSRLSRRLGVDLVCGHVNHQLRGADADRDEACAENLALRLGVKFVRAAVELGLNEEGNLEERAREVRYAALHRLALEEGCARIATGHTEDDQAETVLLRLTRGAGPLGIAGIRPCRSDGVIRPLIDCSRESVRSVVRELGLTWREDSSNQDVRFQRNMMRQRVVPVLRELNPRATQAISRAAALLQAQEEIVQEWVVATLAGATEGGALRVDAIRTIAAPLRGYLVRGWLVEQGVGPRRLTARHVDSVLALAGGSRASGEIALPGNRIVRRRYSLLTIDNRSLETGRPWDAQTLAPGGSIQIPGGWLLTVSQSELARSVGLSRDLWSAACDAKAVTQPFTVRCPRRGERVRPLGLSGSRKLSDLFTDRKVPASERWCHPVVEFGGEIVWVPGVVRTEFLKIRAETRQILHFTACRQ